MKLHHHLTSALFLLQLAACNRPPAPGPENEGEDLTAENEEEGVSPDLPCGGADLKNDDLNCGSCGDACNVRWPDTKYAAGGCIDGECGPRWTGWGGHLPPPDNETCEEICAYGGIPCVPRGCSGLTAVVCEAYGEFGVQCDLGDPLEEASIEFAGECDEPVPYPDNVDPNVFVDFACCCDF
jgi:hypothetical protein